MTWVMSMERKEQPIRYIFRIGSLPVARVSFFGRQVLLETLGSETSHATMSDAMREMHRRLNEPAPEGAKVGGRGAGNRQEGKACGHDRGGSPGQGPGHGQDE